jgi:toxin-antitoxin system PIN domain toxin
VIAIDTSVLVYAHRTRFAQHAAAVGWLRFLAEGTSPWGIPVFCLGEFVRVATHPRVLDPPSSVDEALGALEGLLRSPSARVLRPGPGFPGLLADAVRAGDARGNLAFDAQIAALCQQHRVTRLLTQDRDFARFPGLRIETLEGPPPTTSP